MTELIEYLARDDLGRGQQAFGYVIGVLVAVAVLALLLPAIA